MGKGNRNDRDTSLHFNAVDQGIGMHVSAVLIFYFSFSKQKGITESF